jgi:hypothetical protein
VADHGDLFDRTIAALALDIPVISTDARLDLLGVTRICSCDFRCSNLPDRIV